MPISRWCRPFLWGFLQDRYNYFCLVHDNIEDLVIKTQLEAGHFVQAETPDCGCAQFFTAQLVLYQSASLFHSGVGRDADNDLEWAVMDEQALFGGYDMGRSLRPTLLMLHMCNLRHQIRCHRCRNIARSVASKPAYYIEQTHRRHHAATIVKATIKLGTEIGRGS